MTELTNPERPSISDTALRFIGHCDSGEGWDACAPCCVEGATFSSQCEVLIGVDTIEGYCNWMRDLLIQLPDGRIEMQSFGVDEARGQVTVFSIFYGTHTGPGGPVPPTHKSATAHYVYAMDFSGGKLKHLTKIWNSRWTLEELGWV